MFSIIKKKIQKISFSQRKIRSFLKLERWQGPPHIHKVNSMKLCCPLRSVCLFSLLRHKITFKKCISHFILM